MLNISKQTIALPDGREITLETGKLAKQADGSVVVRLGDCMLLATVVASKEAKEGIDFLPLTVDYREKFSSSGKIPGGFFKREGRPTDDEILTMRIVDRVLRPLFPKDYHCEVQVMIQLISHDKNVMPDALTGLAASAALAITDIPFDGPISEVRVGRINGEFVINPSREELKDSDIDMVIGAGKDSVVMVEGEMKEISEKEMVDAIAFAHEAIKPQVEAQLKLAEAVGKSHPKREYAQKEGDAELEKKVSDFAYDRLYEITKQGLGKDERSEQFSAVFDQFKEQYTEEELVEIAGLAKSYFSDTKKKAVRDVVLNEGIRLDGRKGEDIRPIWCEIDYLPSAHGSAIFTRGETQSLTTVTLGSSMDANRIDSATYEGEERFYLHYNFPPFSTGEARPIRGTSRREIGHGNLAQRALKGMIPDETAYTLRVVSDILESNGSSSMATVCAGTMAILDAGITMTRPVSGIAMGLITDGETGKYAVLSDILGDEDHLGDMDFKVCGTEKGITACQMDIKVKGLSMEILEKALMQSNAGRIHILSKVTDTISEARTQFKASVPKMTTFNVPQEFMGAIIGPGGKNIQGLQEETETTIVLEEIDKEWARVEVLGFDQEKFEQAIQSIKDTCFIPEVGATYTGKVVSVVAFGAFVEIKRGVQGLVHISEIEHRRLNKVEEVLNEGDEVTVKLLGLDPKTKKMKLSRKALLPRPERDENKEG